MRVHVSYTVEVSDDLRRAIRNHFGQIGMANREEVKNWFHMHGDAETDTVLSDLEGRESRNDT